MKDIQDKFKFQYFLLILFCFVCCAKDKKHQANDLPNESISDNLSDEATIEWVHNNIDRVLEKNTYQATNGLKMPYRLYIPHGLKHKKMPLLVFLHGRGDRGTDNGTQLYDNSGLFMNNRSLVAPNMQKKYPCIVLIPQCSDKTINEEWAKWAGNTPDTPFKGLGKDGSYIMNKVPSESGAAALELIDKLSDSLNVDSNRIYLIGKSMGGFGTWEFTARRPDLFAAAVPMAGYSDPSQIEKIKHIPFWIFHGDQDESNPVEGSRTMYKLLTEVGADVKYTEYKGANHGESFEKAFNNAELIPWIFSNTKGE